uniref:Variant surface glycoprotein 1125.190 n=1 Tax=Trypanosoma brucei TaxID=5691 RepID=A0A1J0R5C9_9TRYP|nr:variant surface glycoprotein 1125.190 [Trypanosoma brucei]
MHVSGVFLFFSVTLSVSGNIEPGENAVVAADLCKLARMATAPHKLPSKNTDGNEAHAKIHALNLSVSEPSALKVFEDATDPAKLRQQPPDALAAVAPWPASYALWLSGAQYIKNKINDSSDPIKKATSSLSEGQKAKLKRRLQPLIRAADKAFKMLTHAQATIQQQLQAKPNDELLLAVHGQTTPEKQDADGTKILGPSPQSSRAATCDEGADNTKLSTLGATILCVCSASTADGSQKACFPQTDNAPTWTGGSAANADTTWKTLAKWCGVPGTQATSGTMILEQLQAVTSHIREKGGASYLGTLVTSNSCTGAEGAGVCVKYAGTTSANKKQKLDAVQWISKITAAATSLDALTDAEAQQQDATEKIETLLEQAVAETQESRNDNEPQLQTAVSSGSSPTALEAKQKDCEKIEKAEDCRKNGNCKWTKETDETGNHCKLNETNVAKQAAQAGTGEETAGANSEGKKCSDKKKEGDCTGNCKWDGKECKDSSILVNKQFALSMVSAAFVALLF